MRVCFITNQSIARHATMKRAIGLAPPLTRLNHEVTVLMADEAANRKLVPGLPGVECCFFQPGSAQSEWRQKTAFLRKRRFDAIHACGLGFRNFVRHTKTLSVMDHVELESSIRLGSPRYKGEPN